MSTEEIKGTEANVPQEEVSEEQLSEQRQIRREKLKALQEAGCTKLCYQLFFGVGFASKVNMLDARPVQPACMPCTMHALVKQRGIVVRNFAELAHRGDMDAVIRRTVKRLVRQTLVELDAFQVKIIMEDTFCLSNRVEIAFQLWPGKRLDPFHLGDMEDPIVLQDEPGFLPVILFFSRFQFLFVLFFLFEEHNDFGFASLLHGPTKAVPLRQACILASMA